LRHFGNLATVTLRAADHGQAAATLRAVPNVTLQARASVAGADFRGIATHRIEADFFTKGK
jgi:hypothetical protein